MPSWSDFTRVQRGLLAACPAILALLVLAIIFDDDLAWWSIVLTAMVTLGSVTSLVLSAREQKRARERDAATRAP